MSTSPSQKSPAAGNTGDGLDNNNIAYKNSLRELVILIAIWGIALAWTIGYCYFNAYWKTGTENQIGTTFGFPTWVFWGVMLPWVLCGIVSVLFALFGIAEDDDDVAGEMIVAGESQ